MNNTVYGRKQSLHVSFSYKNSCLGLSIILFLETISLSSVGNFFPAILFIINIASHLITLEMIIVYLLCTKLTMRRLIILMSMTFFSVIIMFKSGGSNPLILAIFIGITTFGVSINFQKISRIYFYSLLFAHLTIIVLSLFGVLPKSGHSSNVPAFQSSYQEIEYFWGYGHPNEFGTIMLVLLICFIFSFTKIKKSTKILLSLLVFAFCIEITAGTAAVGALIIALGLVFESTLTKFYKFFYKFTIGLICFLPLFSLWMGFNSTTKLALLFNRYVQSRPMVWNYYLNHFPMELFASRFRIDLSIGGGGVIGNGALDGTYIYVLLHWGIVALIIILFSWIIFLKSAQYAGQMSTMLIVLGMMTSIIALPESPMVFFYENILCLGVGLAQLNKEELKQVLTYS